MKREEAKTPEQKMEYVAERIRNAYLNPDPGNIVLLCPYCGGSNQFGAEVVCCSTFGKAAMAAIEREGTRQLIDDANRLADKISRN